ncbi:N-6 DNA methylase [Bacillus toyonensis]|uniref:N-6 DNA methylase n=1 Tax=Bacillus toyonensis TaxID=155322 RepID=UPI0036ED6994
MSSLEKIFMSYVNHINVYSDLEKRKLFGYAATILYLHDQKNNDDFFYKKYVYDLVERDFEFSFDLRSVDEELSIKSFKDLTDYIKTGKQIQFEIWEQFLSELLSHDNPLHSIDWSNLMYIILPQEFLFYTPDFISDIASEVLLEGRQPNKVLRYFDGTFGVGKSSVFVKQKIRNRFEIIKLKMAGYELKKSIYLFAKFHMLFTKEYDIFLRLGDSRTLSSVESPIYDCIFSHYENDIKSIKSSMFEQEIISEEMQIINESIKILDLEGTAVFVTSNGLLYRELEKDFRKSLLDQDYIEAIISFKEQRRRQPLLERNLVIVKKNKSRLITKILFMDLGIIDKSTDRDELLKKCLDVYRNPQDIEGFSKQVAISSMENYSLATNRYVKDSKIVHEVLGELNVYPEYIKEQVSLGDYVEVINGLNLPSTKIHEHKDGQVKLVKLSDIEQQELKVDTIQRVNLEYSRDISRYTLRAGDLLLSSRGYLIKKALVSDCDEPLILSQNLYALRAKKNTNIEFINAYLDSPMGQYLLQQIQSGTAIKIIPARLLDELPVPYLTVEEQDMIAEKIRKANDEYSYELNRVRNLYKNSLMEAYETMHIADGIK